MCAWCAARLQKRRVTRALKTSAISIGGGIRTTEMMLLLAGAVVRRSSVRRREWKRPGRRRLPQRRRLFHAQRASTRPAGAASGVDHWFAGVLASRGGNLLRAGAPDTFDLLTWWPWRGENSRNVQAVLPKKVPASVSGSGRVARRLGVRRCKVIIPASVSPGQLSAFGSSIADTPLRSGKSC